QRVVRRRPPARPLGGGRPGLRRPPHRAPAGLTAAVPGGRGCPAVSGWPRAHAVTEPTPRRRPRTLNGPAPPRPPPPEEGPPGPSGAASPPAAGTARRARPRPPHDL